jgi:hypothetical protein
LGNFFFVFRSAMWNVDDGSGSGLVLLIKI